MKMDKKIKSDILIEKPIEIDGYQIALIEWRDATVTDGHIVLTEDKKGKGKIAPMRTVGFVLAKEVDKGVTVAVDYFVENKKFRELVAIPYNFVDTFTLCTEKDLKDNGIKIVHWMDASYIDDSCTRSQKRCLEVCKVQEVYTVGFVFDESPDKIMLYKAVDTNLNEAHAIQTIPVSAVIS